MSSESNYRIQLNLKQYRKSLSPLAGCLLYKVLIMMLISSSIARAAREAGARAIHKPGVASPA